MESFNFAVGLGPAGSGLLNHGAGLCAGPVPQSGAVTGAVVGQDPLRGDPHRGIPGGCSHPEPGGGDGFLIGEDLRVHDAGTVIDGGVDVAVADTTMLGVFPLIASSSAAPAAPVRDPS